MAAVLATRTTAALRQINFRKTYYRLNILAISPPNIAPIGKYVSKCSANSQLLFSGDYWSDRNISVLTVGVRGAAIKLR